MPKYPVLSPLDHDGQHYAIGSTVEIETEEVSGPLLDVSTIGLPGTSLPALQGDALPLGSEFLPAQIRVSADLVVVQVQAAAAAQVASGLDVAAWNALPVEEREREIIAVVQSMQREAEAKADADAKAQAEATKTAPPAPGKKTTAAKE